MRQWRFAGGVNYDKNCAGCNLTTADGELVIGEHDAAMGFIINGNGANNDHGQTWSVQNERTSYRNSKRSPLELQGQKQP